MGGTISWIYQAVKHMSNYSVFGHLNQFIQPIGYFWVIFLIILILALERKIAKKKVFMKKNILFLSVLDLQRIT